jgi:hypothetical protein
MKLKAIKAEVIELGYCLVLLPKRNSKIDDELSASGFAKLPATPEWILEIESK